MAIAYSDVYRAWDMEEGTGSSLTDETGNNNGTINGATWTTGGPTNLNNGLDFNGSSHYVSFGFNPNQSTLSVEIWATIDVASTTGVLLGHGNLGGGGQFDVFTESSALKGRTRYSTSGDTTDSVASISTATLLHIVYTYDSSEVEIWVDGSSDGAVSASGSIGTGSQTLNMGSVGAGSSSFYNGKIWCARLYNRVLTSDEIAFLYNSGAGVAYADLEGGATFKPIVSMF